VVLPDGLAITGAILADQIKSLDWQARNTVLICRLPPETIREVLRKAGALLSLAV
jgi:mRNA interferase MazF